MMYSAKADPNTTASDTYVERYLGRRYVQPRVHHAEASDTHTSVTHWVVGLPARLSSRRQWRLLHALVAQNHEELKPVFR